MSEPGYWADCVCGHGRNGHFDETLHCDACECEHYLQPGQRLRDVMLPKLAAAAGLLLVLGGCSDPDFTNPGNTDPRNGYVTFDWDDCLFGGCVWNYKICVGPDLKFRVDDTVKWVRKSPECKP